MTTLVFWSLWNQKRTSERIQTVFFNVACCCDLNSLSGKTNAVFLRGLRTGRLDLSDVVSIIGFEDEVGAVNGNDIALFGFPS